jgi:NADP-dependent 3-hydroxy acid dehydrogenase YdfG
MTIPGISGRIAVVTGASSGIGEAIARALAAAGASVVINARRTPRIERLAAELGGPARVVAVAGDASDQRVIDALLTAARDRFGEGAREADLVIVNAGRGLRGSAYDSDPGQWDELIQTNLVGAARLMRSAAQRMAGSVPIVKGPPQAAVPPTPPRDWPSQRRDIVLLGSAAGRHISPLSSMYGSTKAAVHMLAESLRRLIGPRGVRVTVVEPGVVKSEFQEAAGYDADSFGRYAESISPVLSPEDVARLVLFVVSQPAGMHVCDVMVRPTRQEYP